MLACFSISAQSVLDTKEFLEENIEGNDALDAYQNSFFYDGNILIGDANSLVNKRLTDSEFEHLIIYFRDMYFDGSRNRWWASKSEAVDVRGITKVSTTKKTDADYGSYYIVNVYTNSTYISIKSTDISPKGGLEYENISKMQILLSDDKNLALKIKKAILHLVKIAGGNATDGDLF